LSPKSYNGVVGLAVFCPITTQIKGYPFEVPIPSGLAARGVVLTDQIKSLDWRKRNIEYKGALPGEIVKEVFETVRTLIDPSETI
jgi:mRNA interferase MazF